MGQLGDTLRDRRVALGMSLDEVEGATKIRARLLAALEEGAYDTLPNPGYVRGYISSYARFLELDPMPLLAMYKAETGAGRYHELNLPQTSEAVKPSHEQHAVPWRAAVAVVLAIAVFSLAVWGITRLVKSPEPTPPEPAPLTSPTPTATTPESSPGGSVAKPSDQPASEVVPFTLVVGVAADSASWVRVTVDGKNAYEGTLAGGQTERFEVAKKATVRVGNPSVVTITKDGVPVHIPESGGSPSVTISAQSAK
ncbi:MAG: helix-turn-helix domain-containing protein [Actinobacteria bacterium]|nr:MAG: helix-turn-helix domain-containing protein [Actinomycetota bacterium]